MCTHYVRHIEGYRNFWFVMSLSCLYTHSYSPHKQYKYYKYMYDVLVMSCILCTCTRNLALHDYARDITQFADSRSTASLFVDSSAQDSEMRSNLRPTKNKSS